MGTSSTATASFHNTVNGKKRSVLLSLLHLLTVLPGWLMLAGILCNLVLALFGTKIPQSLWIPLAMVIVFCIQCAIRYFTDSSFSFEGNIAFTVSFFVATIWFMGLLYSL